MKATIEQELKEFVNGQNPITDFPKTIELFLNALDVHQLIAIRDNILLPTGNFTGNQLVNARTVLATQWEPFIKNIYKQQGVILSNELKACLTHFFNQFSFLQTDGNYYKFFDKDDDKISIYAPDFFDGKMPFGKAFKLAYDLRNAISHNGKLHGNKMVNVDTVNNDIKFLIISYLFVTFKVLYKDTLGVYLNKVKTDFEKWQARFVHLKGNERFEEIALFAIETDWNIQRKDAKREGSINDLRKKLERVNQLQMLIIGDAGMGKSTTMQYLALTDAQNYAPTKRIPIYIELKLLTDASLTIEQYIIKKYQFVEAKFVEQLTQGKITLFLDGLNEIEPSVKQKLYRNISHLIVEYPKCFLLISSRGQNYRNEFANVPVFELQKMDAKQIDEFLTKNTKMETVRQAIQQAVKLNSNWLPILGTPLMLFMLINVVERDPHQQLPDDENKIILRFLKNLYQRELQKGVLDFDPDAFHDQLSHVAFSSSIDKGSTNAGMTPTEIDTYLKEYDTKIGRQEIKAFLQKATELHLLVKDELLYTFAHQTYQETLGGDYMNKK